MERGWKDRDRGIERQEDGKTDRGIEIQRIERDGETEIEGKGDR